MMGFFSSESLAALAPGLATFIDNPTSPFRLIVCPLLKQEDQAALKEGVSQSDAAIIAANAIRETLNTEDFIRRHTLKCLAWLLAAGRLEIKIALMREGLFHPKVWLFYHRQHTLAAHGSSNATGAGLQKNIEQVAVARSWSSSDENYTIQTLQNKFKDLWNDQETDCVVIDMPKAVRQDLLRDYKPATPPTEEDLNTLYHKAAGMRGIAETAADYASPEFAIPASLKYRTGAFAHQGAAVQAWLDNECRGVLEMATGSGKTITAMICAKKLAERINKPLLIVVAAPYVPAYCAVARRNRTIWFETAQHQRSGRAESARQSAQTHQAANPQTQTGCSGYRCLTRYLVQSPLPGNALKLWMRHTAHSRRSSQLGPRSVH